MTQTNVFQSALDLVNKSGNVLVTTHTRPDGDACGCVVAVTGMLKSLGKTVQSLLLSELPEWYEFLFEQKPVFFQPDKTPAQLADIDLVILVDVNSDSQLSKFADWLKTSKKKVLVFDHHVTNDGLGDVEIIDTSASATSLIIYDFLKFADWQITEGVARALFVAVATDTGWFQFSNTDSRTFAVAAELIKAGAEPTELYRRLYQNFSPQRFKLMTRMLNSLELHFDGRFAVQQLTVEDFKSTGASYKDTENLIDQCRLIKTVQAAALFVELKDGRVRCSLRSGGKIDVRKVAQEFGGGGHICAAGVYLQGPLQNAKRKIFDSVKQQFGA
ncbi:MAG: bifunctional oligoribonuclease/PAP phosphatase NrnA [Phycisphaerales bacterium]|jgi:phosphoesterase RecJ-like protein